MSYQVKLQVFEGPLDLLLFLIKKEEIDIYSVQIAKITQQYLEYIELMEMLDLEIAGEFILMAATLMRIKARMMLPVEGEEGEEVEELKDELIRSLIEYKRFKEVSETLSNIEFEERKRFARSFSYEQELKPDDFYSLSEDYSIFDLITVLKNVLDRIPERNYYAIKREKMSVEKHMEFVMSLFGSNEKLSFMDIISDAKDKLFIVVTFLAVLELSKRRLINLRQVQPFQDIFMYRWH
jgi:segregation and condensation protein A